MEPRQNYLTVGIFVTLGFIAFAGFIIWLSGTHDRRSYDNYRVYFTESVNGLNVGSAVKYRGVEVGRIDDIAIDPTNAERIMVTARIASTTPIRTDTTATLKPLGITGLNYLELSGGSANAAPLAMNEEEGVYVIPSTPSQLSQIVTTLPELAERFSTLADQLGKLVSDENVSNVSGTLANINHMTQTLSDNSNNIETLIADMRDAMNHIASASKSVDELASNTQGDTEAALKSARAAIDELSALLKRTNEFSSDGYRELYRLLVELRKASRDVQTLTKGIGENPSKVLFPPKDQGVTLP